MAAELIRFGAVSLNYSVCEKTDAPVKENDVISVRGKGKGKITAVGGRSKKDRLFIEAEIYLN
jgi:RNA-binding protein YlmH